MRDVPRILVLGAGLLHRRHYQLIKAMGCFTIGVDRNATAPARDEPDIFLPIDPADVDTVVAAARKHVVDAILPLAEFGVLPAAEAAARLGLNFLTTDVARAAHDKLLMRNAWEEHGIRQPRFLPASSLADAASAAGQLGYPLVIKPRTLSGARGVRRIHAPSELTAAYMDATSFCEPPVILEEYVEGIETSVEGAIVNGVVHVLACADKSLQKSARYSVTRSINYPGAFDRDQAAAIENTAAACVKALGLDNTPFHLECFVAGSEAVAIECGARGGGGHIYSDIVALVSGVDLVRLAVQLLLGERPPVTKRGPAKGACYRFLFPPQGRFVSLGGLEKAAALPGVVDLVLALAPGDAIAEPEDGSMRVGYLVTKGAHRGEALGAADRVESILQWNVN